MHKEIEQSYRDLVKRNLEVIALELKNHRSLLLEASAVFDMAKAGLSHVSICRLYKMAEDTITQDPTLLYEFNRGRAQVGTKVRTAIIDNALDKDNLTAQIYLDKIYNKEDNVQQIDVTVTSKPLETINTEDLLNITFTDDSDGHDTSN